MVPWSIQQAAVVRVAESGGIIIKQQACDIREVKAGYAIHRCLRRLPYRRPVAPGPAAPAVIAVRRPAPFMAGASGPAADITEMRNAAHPAPRCDGNATALSPVEQRTVAPAARWPLWPRPTSAARPRTWYDRPGSHPSGRHGPIPAVTSPVCDHRPG